MKARGKAIESLNGQKQLIDRVVSRIVASWNQLDGWLRQVEGLCGGRRVDGEATTPAHGPAGDVRGRTASSVRRATVTTFERPAVA